MSELVDSGLLACTFSDTPGLHAAIASLTLTDPTKLYFRAAHWAAGAALAMPAGGGAAAVARRAALEQLRFLSLASVLTLEDSTSTLPSKATVFLVGLMGDCRTNDAARTDEMADCQVAAAALRGLFAAGSAAGTMARGLKDSLLQCTLPDVYLPASSDPDTLLAQLRDGVTYHSSQAGRAQVERSRILSTTARVRSRRRSRVRVHLHAHTYVLCKLLLLTDGPARAWAATVVRSLSRTRAHAHGCVHTHVHAPRPICTRSARQFSGVASCACAMHTTLM